MDWREFLGYPSLSFGTNSCNFMKKVARKCGNSFFSFGILDTLLISEFIWPGTELIAYFNVINDIQNQWCSIFLSFLIFFQTQIRNSLSYTRNYNPTLLLDKTGFSQGTLNECCISKVMYFLTINFSFSCFFFLSCFWQKLAKKPGDPR